MRTADVKDQIELSGNDIQAVSMTGEKMEGALSARILAGCRTVERVLLGVDSCSAVVL